MDKRQILQSIRDERAHTLDLLRIFEHDTWDTATALPGWRVREVVAHLVSTDKASVTGAILPQVFSSMEKLERWNDEQVSRWSDLDPDELTQALELWGKRFAIVVAAVPTPAFRLRLPTMLGRAHIALLIWVRAYDEWVHRQDILRATGGIEDRAWGSEAATFALRAIAATVLPKVHGANGLVAIELEDVDLPPVGYDLSSGRAGPALADDATTFIRGPATEFLMAVAGRDSFEDVEMDGLLEIKGDRRPAEVLLSKTRIV